METPLTDTSRPGVVILPDLEALSREAAAAIVEHTNKDTAAKGKFSIALSGGSTPGRLYGLLGEPPFRDRVDWQRIHFFWADERCVPKEDEASNYRLAYDALLSRIPLPQGNIHRMEGEKGPAEGARDYEREIRDFFQTSGTPNFDLILLGVGEDGHTASLFPGSETLRERERLVLPVYVKEPALSRMTLSLRVLNGASHILFLVSGKSKAAVVREILGTNNHKEKYPAGLVQPVRGNVTWLIDEEAASQLRQGGVIPAPSRGGLGRGWGSTVREKLVKATPPLVLAGDIGGTHTRLGIFGISQGRLQTVLEKTFPSPAYGGLKFILREFLDKETRIDAACFGVAGPVIRETVKTTNLPWVVSAASLKRELQIERVEVINDLVANAYGIATLTREDFETLNKGRRVEGNAGLISAGTGLGEALLFWDGKRHLPSPSEGGHAEFGPRNRLEMDLLESLMRRFDHVSYERILSGAGIVHIYQFLRDSGRFGNEPGWLTERMRTEPPAAVITAAAQLKKSRLCARAVDLFVSIYGAAAGNLALKVMAVGGIYIGGGIAPKLIWKLKDGTFMKAFKEKGRYATLMSQIPVRVILNDRTALLGAAHRAAELL